MASGYFGLTYSRPVRVVFSLNGNHLAHSFFYT